MRPAKRVAVLRVVLRDTVVAVEQHRPNHAKATPWGIALRVVVAASDAWFSAGPVPAFTDVAELAGWHVGARRMLGCLSISPHYIGVV